MSDIKTQLLAGIELLQKDFENNINTPLQLNVVLSNMTVD
jgi:hypothetical protein